MRKITILTFFVLLTPGILLAQTEDNADQRFKAMEERISALEAEIKALKAGQPAVVTTPATPPTTVAENPTPVLPAEPSGQLPTYGGASASAKLLNPDISVIGDFLGSVGKNPVRPLPALEMHESEVGFQAIVDPYARADFFISFGEQGVNLEEGFITFTSLPGGFVAKVGKMRSAFGKVNTLHNHVLPWTDRPMVTDNLVGGEDGIDDAGFFRYPHLACSQEYFS